ncbi:hypothetical protein MXB_568 [Myxobolus squamalis]|nr:hypothetical protein MXB_568 [Myxobolus squamalis]
MEKILPAVQPTSPSSEKFRITWDNINATVTLPSTSIITKIRKRGEKIERKRQILFDVSGEAYSNSMLAIMGESGSGKTTLLNILAGTYSNKIKVNGSILLNGRNINITSVSAYVEQMDLFIPTLTVREHLQFYAKLLLGSRFSNKQIESKVNDLISDFGLEKCKNSQIGSVVRPGISGGECRRLSIASQVISKPKIIFLDEPTCGLDSFTAETVVNILKKLSMNNCAIISTIHQPSSQLFNSFDRLILLAEGKIVYSGPRDQAIGLFQKAGFECPINYNPSDFFIEVLAIKSGREEECRTQITTLIEENAKIINDRRSQNEILEVVIPAELAVFRREHRKRLYDTSIYYLSKTLVFGSSQFL